MKFNKKIIVWMLCMIMLVLTIIADEYESNNVISCWGLDTQEANDTMGINNPVVVSATLNTTDCKVGNCFKFVRDNTDYISYTANKIPSGASPRTFCFWTYADSNQAHVYDYPFWYGTAVENKANSMYYNTANTHLYGNSWANDFDSGKVMPSSYEYWCYQYDGTRALLWQNGVNVVNDTYTSDTTNTNFLLARNSAEDGYYGGFFDEVIVYNSSINESVIQSLYNSGDGVSCELFGEEEIVLTTNIDLLFKNETSTTYKDTFSEGEELYTFINLTYDNNNSAIESSHCNLTYYDSVVEHDATNNNFTVCSSGCDYTEYKEEFNFANAGANVKKDFIHFNSCHENIGLGDLNIEFSCDGSSNSYIIPSSSIPLCSIGYSSIFLTDTEETCLTELKVNVSITDSIYNKRKRIENLEYDRKHYTHKDIFNESIFYNATSELYYNIEAHEYYEHGIYNITIECTNENTDLNINYTENITIVNIAPKILFNDLLYNGGNVLLINDTLIEYSDGDFYNFSITINDDDLDTINITFTDSLNNEIAQFNSLSNTTYNIGYFNYSDFDNNPFYIYVWDNDSYGDNVTKTLRFNVTDTQNPTIIDLLPENLFNNITTHIRGEDLRIRTQHTDEALFKSGLKLWLSNGTILFSNETLFPTLTTSSIIDFTLSSLNITQDYIYGSANSSDGHTDENVKEKLKDSIFKTDSNIISADNYNIILDAEIKDFSLIYLNDRISIDTELNNKVYSLSHRIYPQNNIAVHIIKNTEYDDYLIIGDMWIDFVSDNVLDVKIIKVNGGEYYDVNLVINYADKIKYNSIGFLNSIHKDFIITVSDTPIPVVEGLSITNVDFTEQTQVLLFAVFIILWIALLIISYQFKSFVFGSMGFFVGIVLGLMVSNLSLFLTFVFLFLNIAFFLELARKK